MQDHHDPICLLYTILLNLSHIRQRCPKKKDQLLTVKVCAAVEFWGRKGITCPSGVTMSMLSFSNCLPKIFDNANPNNLGISFMRFILV
ncbi:MAG: hypothetical protein CM1200mP6_05880 [Anaerolineaceae bacterium]|nr:MAG: hypothetical protein CM1200mP6_05880 [Anaerolineaceae bacterium]